MLCHSITLTVWVWKLNTDCWHHRIQTLSKAERKIRAIMQCFTRITSCYSKGSLSAHCSGVMPPRCVGLFGCHKDWMHPLTKGVLGTYLSMCPIPWGDPGPHLIHSSMGHQKSTSKQHPGWFSHFCKCRHTQTDHAALYQWATFYCVHCNKSKNGLYCIKQHGNNSQKELPHLK